MPCDTSYMYGSEEDEKRYKHVMEQRNAHLLTQMLCAACSYIEAKGLAIPSDIQKWWGKHQKEDAERIRLARETALRQMARENALAKLTPEEKEALGVRW